MKIFYWAPWIGNVGTIKAVVNSSFILSHYSKQKISTKIIDAVGEWSSHSSSGKDNFINLSKFKIYKFLPQGGFLKSRFTFIMIFIFSFLPLLRLIKKQRPDFLIVQLITSLPIFLSILFNLDTKIILRISGFPKMNMFRKILWRIASKKIHKVTFPSKDLYEQFTKLKIFDESKMYVLYDPILKYREISHLKYKKNLPDNLLNEKYLLAIGRLTKQKNFEFLIKNFKEISKKYKQFKLVIIGEGELEKKLKKQIKLFKLEEKVLLLGFQKNVYKFLKNAEVFILTSLWEEIGFVLVEASSCDVNIISSDCKNGPKEFLQNGLGGYLFKNNNSREFLEKFDTFVKENNFERKTKKILAKKESKNLVFFIIIKLL